MRTTIFNTPILAPILRAISLVVLRLIGWRAENRLDGTPRKAIILAAPHTSNWDFLLFLMIVFALRINMNVLIKHTIFWFPLGAFLRYCGAIPVDRRAAGARVKELASTFSAYDDMILLITPEGTRSPRTHWKTGFYHMAEAADVPVIIAFVDTENKTAGLDHLMPISGDVEADMAHVYGFYDQLKGLVPSNYASPNRPAPEDS